jgi:hypothetical protein
LIVDRMRVLACVLGALVLVLLAEWVWPSGWGEPGTMGSLHLPHGAPKASLQARAATEWADSVLARPLFSISRRPARAEPHSGSAAAPDQARLAGILIGQFGKRAIFAPEGGGKPLVLGEGASVNESTIRSIEPGRVILASGTVMTPSFDKNRTPSVPFTPPFQPAFQQPNQPFAQPQFPNGQMPGAGFPNQRSVMPQPQPVQPQADTDNDGGDQPETTTPQPTPVPVPGVPGPVPIFRGPVIPQRR